MAELIERARRVRESIMDHTRSDGVVPTTAQLCQDLDLSSADLAEDLMDTALLLRLLAHFLDPS